MQHVPSMTWPRTEDTPQVIDLAAGVALPQLPKMQRILSALVVMSGFWPVSGGTPIFPLFACWQSTKCGHFGKYSKIWEKPKGNDLLGKNLKAETLPRGWEHLLISRIFTKPLSVWSEMMEGFLVLAQVCADLFCSEHVPGNLRKGFSEDFQGTGKSEPKTQHPDTAPEVSTLILLLD